MFASPAILIRGQVVRDYHVLQETGVRLGRNLTETIEAWGPVHLATRCVNVKVHGTLDHPVNTRQSREVQSLVRRSLVPI